VYACGVYLCSAAVWRCVAVCCSELQCVAECCRVLQSVQLCCSVLLRSHYREGCLCMKERETEYTYMHVVLQSFAQYCRVLQQ